MTNKLDKLEKGRSERDRRTSRLYLKEFGLAMGLYFVTIIGTGLLGNDREWKKWFFVVVNFIPVLLVVRAVWRSLQRADEFERLVQYKGFSLGFVAAMLTSLACAFAASIELAIPALAAGWAPFAMGMIAWGIYVGPRLNTMGSFRK
jgi:hypothetical protein